tara:strand:- start:36 stop:179 length:144 start_codon:yes stop_codon:yes gene_type:complete
MATSSSVREVKKGELACAASSSRSASSTLTDVEDVIALPERLCFEAI